MNYFKLLRDLDTTAILKPTNGKIIIGEIDEIISECLIKGISTNNSELYTDTELEEYNRIILENAGVKIAKRIIEKNTIDIMLSLPDTTRYADGLEKALILKKELLLDGFDCILLKLRSIKSGLIRFKLIVNTRSEFIPKLMFKLALDESQVDVAYIKNDISDKLKLGKRLNKYEDFIITDISR